METRSIPTLSSVHADTMTRELLNEILRLPSSIAVPGDTDIIWTYVVGEGAPVPVDVVLSPNPPHGPAYILRLFFDRDGLVAYECSAGAGSMVRTYCNPRITPSGIRAFADEVSSFSHPVHLRRKHRHFSEALRIFHQGIFGYSNWSGGYPVRVTWTRSDQLHEAAPMIVEYWSPRFGTGIEYLAPDSSAYLARIVDPSTGFVWSIRSEDPTVAPPDTATQPLVFSSESTQILGLVDKIGLLAEHFPDQSAVAR